MPHYEEFVMLINSYVETSKVLIVCMSVKSNA